MATILSTLADNKGAKKKKRLKGRGIGSTKGKTAGAGHKGQKARTGVSIKGFEGGQMPIYRRLPKRGFNSPFRKEFATVNTGDLQRSIDAGKLDAKGTVNVEALLKAGLIRSANKQVKLLGKGELKAKVTIEVNAASESATKLVEKAGGKVVVLAAKASSKAEAVNKEKSEKSKAKKAAKQPKGGNKKAAAQDENA